MINVFPNFLFDWFTIQAEFINAVTNNLKNTHKKTPNVSLLLQRWCYQSFIYFYVDHKVFYKIDFMKRDEKNTVRGYVTELYQCVSHESEMEPPPPYILNPESRSSSIINLSWEEPKTRLKIVKYTVQFQRRRDENSVDTVPAEVDR